MDTIWRDTSPSGIYEEARIARVFNTRRPKHQPTAIFHVTSKADIIKAVQVAREKKLLIAVRSGGHSYSTWSLHENSILIDLGNYCEYTVDVERSEAWVSSGLRSNIDLELMEKYGLMLGAGHHPDVGLGGYFLQGGLSWKCRVRKVFSYSRLFLFSCEWDRPSDKNRAGAGLVSGSRDWML